jgi:hypothetical protein
VLPKPKPTAGLVPAITVGLAEHAPGIHEGHPYGKRAAQSESVRLLVARLCRRLPRKTME